jgi:membrane protein implicated in regulation of membrane protease activity
MRRFVRESSLSLFFGLLFVLALVAQAFAGWTEHNNDLVASGLATVSLGQYVTSATFAVDVTENWQSEYLQFLLYVILTVWLVQRGSPESKELGQEGIESDEEQLIGRYARDDSPQWAKTGGWRTALFSRSLGLTMGAVFVASWAVQAIAGWVSYNEQRMTQLQEPLPLLGYVSSADFWSRTLQNWQSEFLAVGSMAVLSIYLRQRGSPESKPTGSAHSSTGVSG